MPLVSGGMAFAEAEIEEVVVTAERRERPLEQAPLTAHVSTALDLEKSVVRTSQELVFRTPGLQFSTNTVLGQPYLRGVGSDLITAGAENTVATLVDGVYLARPLSSIQDFYDVERVEVLKGPQGALFGRNATGGVIQIVTRDPEPGAAAEVDFTYGNFDALRARVALNLPLVKDRVTLRVAGIRTQRDGYSLNLANGKRVDDEDFFGLRAKLLVQPSDRFSVLFSGDMSNDRGTRNLVFKVGAPLSGSPAVALGGIVPSNPRKVRFDSPTGTDLRSRGGSAHVRWEGERVEISSVTAFRRTALAHRFDIDGTELAVTSNSPTEKSSVWTEELQLRSSEGGAIEWIAGLFFLDEEVFQSLDVSLPVAGIRDQPEGDVHSSALGLFGNLTWSPTEWARISAGIRYSRDWREIDFRERVNGADFALFDRDLDQDGWTPRFVIEVGPCHDWTVYASASRGYKAGGFNTTIAQPEAFSPETLWSFELGTRGRALGEHLTAHVAGFVYLYDRMQLNIVNPGSSIPFPLVRNAGSATVEGAELGIEYDFGSGIAADAAGTWLHAEFDRLHAFSINAPASNPDRSGNPLPNAPTTSFWVGGEWRVGLGEKGSIVPRIEYRYQSRVYFDPFKDRFASQSAFGLLGAQLRYSLPNDRVSLTVFGRNLTNELYAHSGIRQDGRVGNILRWGAPRTVGVELAARF